MTLTEKVRQNIGGVAFRVYELAGVSAGISYALSMDSFGLNYVYWGTYHPKSVTLSGGSTTYPTLLVAESSGGGTDLTLSAHAISAEGGTLMIWGN